MNEFQNFASQYSKDYVTTEEFQKRKVIFEENLKTINEHIMNGAKEVELGLNEFADLSQEEFSQMFESLKERSSGRNLAESDSSYEAHLTILTNEIQ